MENNNRREDRNQVPDAPAENQTNPIGGIEKQFSQHFRDLLLRTIGDRRANLDIYEFSDDQYVLDCEYTIEMPEEMDFPTYFVKGLAYTDGEIESRIERKIARRTVGKKTESLKQFVSPHKQLVIKNPSIVAVMQWNMGELYSRDYRKFLERIKSGRPDSRPAPARFAHSLNLTIFCRDKEPVSRLAGQLMLERNKKNSR